MFRAVLEHAFELTERGTVLAISVLAGVVKANDAILIATLEGTSIVQVKAVEFLDYDIGKPSFRSLVGLVIDGVRTADIILGQEIRLAPPAKDRS